MIKEANAHSKISMVKNQTFARAGLDLTATSGPTGFQYQSNSIDSNA